MSLLPSRKNKINLSDYNYRRDIETRILLSDLSGFELDVLREILNNSLIVPLAQIAEIIETDESKIELAIQKFMPSKLVRLEGNRLFIDKEMRKYFESQIMKFDETFELGMEFLQGLLNKIPVHYLTQWYAIPRTSEHIFLFLMDKFFGTPKTYEKYLMEIQYDCDLLHNIVKEVYEAPDFEVSAQYIKAKYHLNPAQFEENILLLEYNFACCLNYKKNGEGYEEIITPYYEWREYLRFKRDSQPKPVKDASKIVLKHAQDFGFVLDMSSLMTTALKKPLAIDSITSFSPDYLRAILQKIEFHHFGKIQDNVLCIHETAHEWLEKPIQNKALTFSRHPIKVEKALKSVIGLGWVYVDDFIQSFTAPLNGKEPIHLKQKGKRWRYVLPTYSDEEKAFIEVTLCERLFEAGFVAIGTHEGKKCFTVTSFGRASLEE